MVLWVAWGGVIIGARACERNLQVEKVDLGSRFEVGSLVEEFRGVDC